MTLADRLQGRLDRLDMDADDLAKATGMSIGTISGLLRGSAEAPRGKRLVRLADALSVSVSYLLGLDPDADVPEEYLLDDQGDLGLLAGDEEALLRAYRRLDVSSKGALLLIVTRMSPEAELVAAKPRQSTRGS